MACQSGHKQKSNVRLSAAFTSLIAPARIVPWQLGQDIAAKGARQKPLSFHAWGRYA